MIEWLKMVLFREVCIKIIIVVIYSFYFIDNIIIKNMYVFFCKKYLNMFGIDLMWCLLKL